MSVLFQCPPHDTANRLLIVNHKDASHGFGMFGRPALGGSRQAPTGTPAETSGRSSAESCFGGEIVDDDRTGGAERVAGERAGIRGHERPTDAALSPTFARPQQQAAVLGLQLEDVAEFDVQAASEQRGRGVKEIGGIASGATWLPRKGLPS